MPNSNASNFRPLSSEADTNANPLNLQVGDRVASYSSRIDGIYARLFGRVVQRFTATYLEGGKKVSRHGVVIHWDGDAEPRKVTCQDDLSQVPVYGLDLSTIYLETDFAMDVVGKVADEAEAHKRCEVMGKLRLRHVAPHGDPESAHAGRETMALLARVSMPVLEAISAEFDTLRPRRVY
jgi:hypothetical protein